MVNMEPPHSFRGVHLHLPETRLARRQDQLEHILAPDNRLGPLLNIYMASLPNNR